MRILSVVLMSALALVPASGAAFAEKAQQSAPRIAEDDEHVREIVKAYIEAHPDVVFNAVNKYVADIRANHEREKAKPVIASGAELVQSEGLPVLGNPDGKVKVAYFLDAACGYCRRSVSVIDDVLRKNPDVMIVQRWVPFLTPASAYAARVATVVSHRYTKSYPAFYAALMTQKGQLTADMVDKVVGDVLGDDARGPVKQEASDPSEDNPVARVVTANNALARRLLIDGTPYVYVDGAGFDGIVPGASEYSRYEAAIAKARQALASK